MPLASISQVLAHIVIKTAQDLLAPIRQRHLGTKSFEYAGEFHRDVAAADHQHPPGQILQFECFVRCDAQLSAGNGGLDRPAAGGNKDVPGRDALAIDLDGVGIGQCGAAAHQSHTGIG
jgi:hypothetical protein